jgi:two-component system phosphate regulon response regulator OmpR
MAEVNEIMSEETPEDFPHVLIVDDDTRIRSLLQRYLAGNGYRVTVAGNAEEARARLKGLTFDLIVLDIMMPGESGLSLTESLRKTLDVPILLLTARGEPQDRIAGLEVGADDYLAKPFEPKELLLRIQTIIRRTRPEEKTGREIKMGACIYNLHRKELTRNERPVHLTTAESTLLDLFAHNPGRIFSRTELCENTGAGLERTVDVQMTRLRRKIEEDARAPLYLQTVRGKGYMLVPE